MQDSSIGNLIQTSQEMLLGTGSRLEGKLKSIQSSAGEKQKGELKKAAQEFEAMFMSYLLKVMRETIEESGLLEGGFGKTIYTEMFDQEWSLSMARQGALGISNMIYKNLSEKEIQKDSKDADTSPIGAQKPSASDKPGNKADEQEISDLQLPIQAPVSSSFGVRSDPFSHKDRMHKGIDLAAPEGTNISAPLAGTVVSTGDDNGYGKTILIQHAGGLQTRYAHLGMINVKAGDVVAPQQVLGSVGNTGRSTGPHLHFEVIRMGKAIDPLRTNWTNAANLEYEIATSKRLDVAN
jgi:murein DD-endopeptidase MepM/ murein hydrolase activator NlpD